MKARDSNKSTKNKMLSRSRDVDKIKCKPDNSAAGRTFRLQDTVLHIYMPSWSTGDIDNAQLTQVHHTQQNTNACTNFTGAFLALSSEVDSVADSLCEQINIVTEQSSDETLAKIIEALHNGKLDKKFEIDTQDHRASIFKKHIDKFYQEPGTSVLTLRDSNKVPKLVVPYQMRSAYLHQAHDCINHSGISQMRDHLKDFWWEYKNRDIQAYVESCMICAKQKGNYGRQSHTYPGHCKRGKRPFEFMYTNFAQMPSSKGKQYILTILDSFSPHLTAIPYARERVHWMRQEAYTVFPSAQGDYKHHII